MYYYRLLTEGGIPELSHNRYKYSSELSSVHRTFDMVEKLPMS